jgi:hypothetical protein
MVVPVLLFTLGAAAVLIGARRRHPRRAPVELASQASPVAYQHLQLFQGGLISQAALETAKAELEDKLAQGGALAVESCLRPGLEYVVKIRALGEIGTDEAGQVLERQLTRRISSDPIEQAWYWIDLVQALRGLNRYESLPSLLRCGERSLETPLGHLFAAEVTAFPTFADYLNEPLSPLGQTALRIVRCALEGIRKGFVPVTLYAEAQIGEMMGRLADICPDVADPLIARTFIEGLRHARRSYSSAPELRDDPLRRQTIRWQVSHLRDAEPILREYLHGIDDDLARLLPQRNGREQNEILTVLAELRADAGDVVNELLADAGFQARIAALASLQWSSSYESRYRLCERARAAIADQSKASWWTSKKVKNPVPMPELLAVLKALRGHPGEEAESVLREFARHPKPAFRIAALRSLGWWEPLHRPEVINILHAARIDSNAEVRLASIAALARLGECAAIQVIRDALTNTNVESVHQTIDVIASEGLTWLWPDLDMLTEADNAAIAHHAWEAVEDLREAILGPLA